MPIPITRLSFSRTPLAWVSEDEPTLAQTVLTRSIERWGEGQPTAIVGRHPRFTAALERAGRLAQSDSPVLIHGETGTGKELFARAIYLLSPRFGRPFLTINCAQYQDSQLIASELFGHRRGSFTGAVTDHRGIFETAEDGVVFLDEVGELSPGAQAMLLRLLSEGEIVPVGETRARRVNVRIVVATNRNLKEMVDAGRFRADLYYRLRYLHLQIPPVRERGGDWELLLTHSLEQLSQPGRPRKRFSDEALALLRRHTWPGNVREIRGLVDTGFHLCDGHLIQPHDFAEALEEISRVQQMTAVAVSTTLSAVCGQLLRGDGSFWQLVREPYLERELNRREVRAIIREGLGQTGGSYKELLGAFGMAPAEYLRFMDFLRHHDLKPVESLDQREPPPSGSDSKGG
jgi:transcriptional regulator with GAF, ATPase, and Fis domain